MATMSYPPAYLHERQLENDFHRLDIAKAKRKIFPVHRLWNDVSLGFSLVSCDGTRFYCDARYVREQR